MWKPYRLMCCIFLILSFESGCSSPCAEAVNEIHQELKKIVRENQACESFEDCALVSPVFSCWETCSIAVNKGQKEIVEQEIAKLDAVCNDLTCIANASCPQKCPETINPTDPKSGEFVCLSQDRQLIGLCQQGLQGEYCVTCQENRCVILDFPLEIDFEPPR